MSVCVQQTTVAGEIADMFAQGELGMPGWRMRAGRWQSGTVTGQGARAGCAGGLAARAAPPCRLLQADPLRALPAPLPPPGPEQAA